MEESRNVDCGDSRNGRDSPRYLTIVPPACHPHFTTVASIFLPLFQSFTSQSKNIYSILAFNFSWICNKWTTGVLLFDIMPTVFCSIALLHKIPNRTFLAMTKPLHEQKSRAMLLTVIRQTIIRTMGLKKCNNEPLHDEKRHQKTEVFVHIQIMDRGEIFGPWKKIRGRLFFSSEHNVYFSHLVHTFYSA